MAKIRDETIPYKEEFEKNNDSILLVADNENKTLEAIKTDGKTPKYEKVPINENFEANNKFFEMGMNQDVFDVLMTTIKNGYSQFDNPTRFTFYKLPLSLIRVAGKFLGQQVKEDFNIAKSFLKTSKIDIDLKKQEKISNKKNQEKNMTNINNSNKLTPSEREARIPWHDLGKLGVTRELLQHFKQLDTLLAGGRTNRLVPLTIQADGVTIKGSAVLSFANDDKRPGYLKLYAQFPQKDPDLTKEFYGHLFTPEQRKELMENNHITEIINLERKGVLIPCIVSKDPLTNQLVALPQSEIKIPEEHIGRPISTEEAQELKSGKVVFMEGFYSKAKNKEFDSPVYYSAVSRRLEFASDPGRLINEERILGVELTKSQQEDLKAYKAVQVDGIKSNNYLDDPEYTRWALKDEVTGKVNLFSFNPDSPIENREVYIPSRINGVDLEPDQLKDLQRGSYAFVENMQKRNGQGEYNSFVKISNITGKLMYSDTPNGFNEQVQYEVPKEIEGVKLTNQQRADIQTGEKAAFVKGIPGPNGNLLNLYVYLASTKDKLLYSHTDPFERRKGQVAKMGANQTQQNNQEESKKKVGTSHKNTGNKVSSGSPSKKSSRKIQ